MAAMILPQYHVANFEIQESNPFPINISWSVSDGNMKSQTLFPMGNNFPSVKSLTFDGRSEPMDLGIAYKSSDGIMSGIPTLLARYKIEPPKPKEEKFSLKLRVQLDQNGIPALDTAEQIEEYIEIKKIPVKHHKPDPPPKEDKKTEDDTKKTSKDKKSKKDKKESPKEPDYEYEEKEVKKTRSTQIHFKFEHHGYGAKQIEEYKNIEDNMCKQDNLILEVKVMRNHLETYVYDMRAALDTIGNYIPFIKDSDREPFLAELNSTETWIYDEGESAAKEVYQEKMNALQKIGDPVKARFVFHDVYPGRIQDFENIVNNIFSQAANIPDDSHITKEEKEELIKSCEENTNWVSNVKEIQAAIPKYEDPSFNFEELEERKKKIVELGTKILNKPEPKKEEPKKEEAEKKEGEGEMKEDEAKPEEGKETEKTKEKEATIENGDTEMKE